MKYFMTVGTVKQKPSTTSSICRKHYPHVAQKRCQPYPYISLDSNVELRADIQVTLPSHRARLATLEERQRFQSFTTNAVNVQITGVIESTRFIL